MMGNNIQYMVWISLSLTCIQGQVWTSVSGPYTLSGITSAESLSLNVITLIVQGFILFVTPYMVQLRHLVIPVKPLAVKCFIIEHCCLLMACLLLLSTVSNKLNNKYCTELYFIVTYD